MNPHPALNDCIQSLELHLRCLQRAGLRFDAAGVRSAWAPAPAAARLEALRAQTAECRRCPLCSNRTHVVFGEGDAGARLMLVGDGPDSISDAQGRPFAGESGQLLTRILEAIGLQRSRVYLTGIVKCRSGQAEEGESPGDDAIEACGPILQRQIAVIQPDIICALGPAAARALQGPGARGTPVRGEFYRMGAIPVMPTHHPGLLLRRPELKRETWIDVQKIQRALESMHPAQG